MAFDDFSNFSVGDLFGASGLGGGLDASLPTLDLGALDATLPALALSTPLGGAWTGAAPDGSGRSFFDTALDIGRGALGVLGDPRTLNLAKLGLTGVGAFAGAEAISQAGEQTRRLRQAEKRASQAQASAGETAHEARAAAAPQVAATTALTPAGIQALLGTAPLPPGLEATVEKWTREAKAAAASYYARAGISDSTMMTQLDSWIDSQAIEMRTKLAESLLQSGREAAGAAASDLGTAISGSGAAGSAQAGTLPQQQSTALAQALHDSNQALYDLLGRTAQ